MITIRFWLRVIKHLNRMLYYFGIKKATKKQINYILYLDPSYNRKELEKLSRIEASNLIDKLKKQEMKE